MSTPFLSGFHERERGASTLSPMARAHGGKTPEFGRLLRRYREALGKRHSQDVVMEELQKLGFGKSKSTLSHYENGRPPDIGVLWGLARVYGLKFTTLCELVAAELSQGAQAVEAPEASPTVEASRVARAYDAGPELLKTVLDGAVSLWAHTPDSGQLSPAQSIEPRESAHGSREQKRKSRSRR